MVLPLFVGWLFEPLPMVIHWNIENPWLSITITFAVLPPACDGWFSMFSTVLRLPSIISRNTPSTPKHTMSSVLCCSAHALTGQVLRLSSTSSCYAGSIVWLSMLCVIGAPHLFGGATGSASHTLTGNASVFTGRLGAWNRSAHNLPIRGERTLPPHTVKSLG